MTWLELYRFLSHKVSDPKANKNLFEQKVLIHNIETGDEYMCDTLEIEVNPEYSRLVLAIKYDD